MKSDLRYNGLGFNIRTFRYLSNGWSGSGASAYGERQSSE